VISSRVFVNFFLSRLEKKEKLRKEKEKLKKDKEKEEKEKEKDKDKEVAKKDRKRVSWFESFLFPRRF
jgi:pre-mRNA-processing factor 40